MSGNTMSDKHVCGGFQENEASQPGARPERRARDHPGGKTSGIRQMSDILHQSKVIVCEDR